MYEKYFKRMIDVILSSAALIVLSPVMGVVAVLVRKNLGSPVIFKHKRPGRNEKIFTLYKFRTMTDERDAGGKLFPDDARLTKFGKMIRATSLDELPELVNILRGDMSIVGPRPLEVYFLPYYTETERHRHDVRPGLTGLAQVHGRNNLTWEQRFEYDLEYIKDISFINDIKILFQTVAVALRREGTDIAPIDFNVSRERQNNEKQ
jgi:undecaprenyl phosphate N,N'-diacetylbacillosamine 1-phosphate transferase